MGLEVVVRPVVLPNIRPTTPRVLAPPDNPESGIATMSGGGGKFIGTSYSWSVSVSRSKPHKEQARQVNTERVYQMDDQGNINRNNFIDVERLKRVRLDTGKEQVKVLYGSYPQPENVETLETDKTKTDPNING